MTEQAPGGLERAQAICERIWQYRGAFHAVRWAGDWVGHAGALAASRRTLDRLRLELADAYVELVADAVIALDAADSTPGFLDAGIARERGRLAALRYLQIDQRVHDPALLEQVCSFAVDVGRAIDAARRMAPVTTDDAGQDRSVKAPADAGEKDDTK